jgi:hypothetical protein
LTNVNPTQVEQLRAWLKENNVDIEPKDKKPALLAKYESALDRS